MHFCSGLAAGHSQHLGEHTPNSNEITVYYSPAMPFCESYPNDVCHFKHFIFSSTVFIYLLFCLQEFYSHLFTCTGYFRGAFRKQQLKLT